VLRLLAIFLFAAAKEKKRTVHQHASTTCWPSVGPRTRYYARVTTTPTLAEPRKGSEAPTSGLVEIERREDRRRSAAWPNRENRQGAARPANLASAARRARGVVMRWPATRRCWSLSTLMMKSEACAGQELTVPVEAAVTATPDARCCLQCLALSFATVIRDLAKCQVPFQWSDDTMHTSISARVHEHGLSISGRRCNATNREKVGFIPSGAPCES
jgi:hypothetical protein